MELRSLGGTPILLQGRWERPSVAVAREFDKMTVNRELRTANREPRSANCELRTANYDPLSTNDSVSLHRHRPREHGSRAPVGAGAHGRSSVWHTSRAGHDAAGVAAGAPGHLPARPDAQAPNRHVG